MILKDSIPFLVLTALITTAAMIWITPYAVAPGLLVFGFFVNFFRNPRRNVPEGDCIVSPADGKVVALRKLSADSPDSDGGLFLSIFMSPLDVHVNRAPMAGRIQDYRYFEGKFKPAYDDSATLENERNEFLIHNEKFSIRCSQVAGILARRIVFWMKDGQTVGKGERIGLIKFGSRVDLWLPPGLTPVVQIKERVKAGSSILATYEK
ncbi:MAG: phosphatidylserine decarboxylase [Acidobacteria bacterium]|nr:phosphatidylserine decarboxylase [Acidobacteriota bacterium]